MMNHPNSGIKKVLVNDDAHETYNVVRKIRFYTTMLKSSPCDYSDVYILMK